MSNVNISNGGIVTGENIFDKLKKHDFTSLDDKRSSCFKLYDKDRDGFLNKKEFSNLLSDLFTKSDGTAYEISSALEDKIFKLLDENQDGKIDTKEFEVCWFHWFKQILDPVSALIIVDVQNDFISGSLSLSRCPAGQDGALVVPPINCMLNDAPLDYVIYSLDWHPENHISFHDNIQLRSLHSSSKLKNPDQVKVYDTVVFEGPPQTEQKLWPRHCVQNSWGAETEPDMKMVKNGIVVKKGTKPDIDSYSAFWDNNKLSQTDLLEILTSKKVTDCYICGLAYDVCVGSTALHALEHNFRTIIVDDASKGIEVSEIEAMKAKLQHHGAIIVNSSEVPKIVDASDRRPELGLAAALNVALARKLLKEDQKRKKAP